MSELTFSTFATRVSPSWRCPQDGTLDSRVEATIAALASGADVVYQGAFAGQGWVGYADILRRGAVGTRLALGFRRLSATSPTTPSSLARRAAARSCNSRFTLTCSAKSRASFQSGSSLSRLGAPFAIHEYRVADYAAYVRLVRQPDARDAGKWVRGAAGARLS